MSTPKLHVFTQPMYSLLHLDEPDFLQASWLARYALNCREKPEVLDQILSELSAVLDHPYSDLELNEIWFNSDSGYTISGNGVRNILSIARGAFETAKLSMTIPMPGKR